MLLCKIVFLYFKNGIFKEICKNADKPQFEKLEVVNEYSFDDAFNASIPKEAPFLYPAISE